MKSYNEALKLLEHMAINSHQWPTNQLSLSRLAAGVYEHDAMTARTTQVSLTQT